MVEIPISEYQDRVTIESTQGHRLHQLLENIYGRNPFYTKKIDQAGIQLKALTFPADLEKLPLSTKAEFVADQEINPPWGTALSEPLERYTRYHQTSSTTGQPLRWLDTNKSWQWTLECWKSVYQAAQVGPEDRIFFPFSFGPFLGFWTAFEAGCQLGALCIPGGGMSSELRLSVIKTISPTVVCCTPTYALRLAEVDAKQSEHQTKLNTESVRALIVAGEPGGSIEPTRNKIETSWGARVFDHYGLTEVGPISFECLESPRVPHLNEHEYICEILTADGQPVEDGQPGELVITNLGRTASPVIRYRTGDVAVLRRESCKCGRTLARLDGGIIARMDDMVTVRGTKIYPTAIETVVRQFSEIAEYRATIAAEGVLRTLSIELEFIPEMIHSDFVANKVAQKLQQAFSLKVPVHIVGTGALPRFEMKARRFVVEK